jgi:hypothetical protein
MDGLKLFRNHEYHGHHGHNQHGHGKSYGDRWECGADRRWKDRRVPYAGDEFYNCYEGNMRVHLLEDGVVLWPNIPSLHNLMDMVVFVKDGVVFRNFDRDTNGDLAEVGTDSAVHALETIDGVRDLGSMANELVGLVQDLEDFLIREGI